jgi:hypothetical protein
LPDDKHWKLFATTDTDINIYKQRRQR